MHYEIVYIIQIYETKLILRILSLNLQGVFLKP